MFKTKTRFSKNGTPVHFRLSQQTFYTEHTKVKKYKKFLIDLYLDKNKIVIKNNVLKKPKGTVGRNNSVNQSAQSKLVLMNVTTDSASETTRYFSRVPAASAPLLKSKSVYSTVEFDQVTLLHCHDQVIQVTGTSEKLVEVNRTVLSAYRMAKTCRTIHSTVQSTWK